MSGLLENTVAEVKFHRSALRLQFRSAVEDQVGIIIGHHNVPASISDDHIHI